MPKQNLLGPVKLILRLKMKSREELQKVVDGLKGQEVTEALVLTLIETLRSNDCGILCHCGQPAMPYWRTNSRFSNGGCMQLMHSDSTGKSVTHSGFTKFTPGLIVVEKVDGRRKKISPDRRGAS